MIKSIEVKVRHYKRGTWITGSFIGVEALTNLLKQLEKKRTIEISEDFEAGLVFEIITTNAFKIIVKADDYEDLKEIKVIWKEL